MKLNFSHAVTGLVAGGVALATAILLPGLLSPAQALPPLDNPALMENLDLTDQQQTELQRLRDRTRAQLEALLTTEQKAALQTSLDNGMPLPEAVRDLNLDPEQRQAIRQVMRASRTDFQAVLTPEQRQELRQAREQGGPQGPREGGHRQAWAALNLTDVQRAQIDSIRQTTRDQIAAVLTDAQRSTWQATGADGRGSLRNLDLTETQRSQIHDIMEGSRAAMDSVLTPEQKQQLQQARANRSSEWRGRRDGAWGQPPAAQ